MAPNEKLIQTPPSYVQGIETLCDSAGETESRKDLTLCSICLQWTADGHDCHRPGVCEIQPK